MLMIISQKKKKKVLQDGYLIPHYHMSGNASGKKENTSKSIQNIFVVHLRTQNTLED